MKTGFVFDLDGVITDTAEYHYEAWRKLAAELGIEVDLTFNEKLKGVGRMESLDLILRHGKRQNDFSDKQKEVFAARKNKAYVKSLKGLSSRDILPGALEFLEQTREKEVLCSLASASKNSGYIIKKLGLTEYFDGFVDPESIKKSKPDPEIYLKGAEILGLEPEYCVGFEDARVGVEAIKRAGMYAVGVVTADPLVEADITVHRLDELAVDALLELQDKK